MGIDNLETGLSEEHKIALVNSIVKTDNMINGSNINLSDDSMKAFSNALLKQNFARSIGRYDLEREAREEGLKILTTGRTIGVTTKSKEMNKIALDVIDKYYSDGYTKEQRERR